MVSAQRLEFKLPRSITLEKNTSNLYWGVSLQADLKETLANGEARLLKKTEVRVDFKPSEGVEKGIGTLQMGQFLRSNPLEKISVSGVTSVSGIPVQVWNVQPTNYEFRKLSETRALLTLKHGVNEGVAASSVATGNYSNKPAIALLGGRRCLGYDCLDVDVKYGGSYVKR